MAGNVVQARKDFVHEFEVDLPLVAGDPSGLVTCTVWLSDIDEDSCK